MEDVQTLRPNNDGSSKGTLQTAIRAFLMDNKDTPALQLTVELRWVSCCFASVFRTCLSTHWLLLFGKWRPHDVRRLFTRRSW